VNVSLGSMVADAVVLGPGVNVSLGSGVPVVPGTGVVGSGVVVMSFGVSVGPGVAVCGWVATPVGNGTNVAVVAIVGSGEASDSVAVDWMGRGGSSTIAQICPATNPPQKRQVTMARMNTLCGRDIRRPVPLCAEMCRLPDCRASRRQVRGDGTQTARSA
jgi:hypothetical protein